MKKFLLNVLAASTAVAAMAAPQVPSYNVITLPTEVAADGGHGNNGLADFNGDGNLDIFMKGRVGYWGSAAMYYFTGDGYGFDTAMPISDVDGCSWERILVPIDYDADGDMDLILGASWGSKLLQNDGSGNFTLIENFALDYEMSIDSGDAEKWYDGLFAIADFNLDGYVDIVCFNGNPREDQGAPVIYTNNQGDGTFTRNENCGLQAQRGGTIATGDINGDGISDIVVNGWIDNDCIRAYICNGDGTFTAANNDNFDLTNRGTEKGQIILVDIDADGDLDLFVTGTSCPQGWAKVADIYINDGTGVFTYQENSLPGVEVSGADWCDVNADGYMDLIYTGDGVSSTIVVINQGDGAFDAQADLMGGHRGGAVVSVADFNNNGMIDVLLSGYNDSGSHFQAYNGLSSRGMNTAPTAPTNLAAEEVDGKVTFTWSAGSDTQTPTAALRYNVYVKTKDGKIFSIIPSDPATGKLRSIEVTTAVSVCQYTLNAKASDIEEWGVQTIDGAKLGSEFAKSSKVSALENVEIENVEAVEYFNLQGVKVENPQSGLYIKKQGNKATKVLVK